MWVWIVVALAVASYLWRFYTRYVSAPAGNSPFRLADLRQPGPVLVDKAARKKVLKRKFDATAVPENLDAIVVGSGIGGLSCAAILSKAGYKVLVLEQHGRCGGCCHTYEEKGVEFDVGIHYIGEMSGNTVSRNLSDQITNGQLDWTPIEAQFDQIITLDGKRKDIPVYNDRSATVKALKEAFPDDTAAIDKFFHICDTDASFTPFFAVKMLPFGLVKFLIHTGILNLFTTFFAGAERSVWDVVRETTKNPQLQTAFVYLFMDYGSTPWSASWPMHSVITRHYKYGAYYPKGGASQIPLSVVPVIEESGGAVMMKAPVDYIRFDETGRANGVRVKGVDILAPIVVSDAGVINTFTKLVPEDLALKSRYKRYADDIGSGESAFQIFIGLRGTKEELGITATNYWIYSDSSDLKGSYDAYMAQKTLEEATDSKLGVPVLFTSFPSTKDVTWTERFPGGLSTCVIAGACNWDWFKGRDWEGLKVHKRGDEYDAIKAAFGQKVLSSIYEVFPQLEDKVEFWDLGSPLTGQYYLEAPKGEIAGMDHSTLRFSPHTAAELRPATDIPGLWLTGQDIACCGFAGAMYGGMLCASGILGRNLMSDLMLVKAQRKAAFKAAAKSQ